MPKLHSYTQLLHKNHKIIALIFSVAIISTIGVLVLINSHAASPYVSVTADKGTLLNSASSQLCTGAIDGSCTTFGSTGTTSTFFPIGVYVQPTTNFATWKSRGVNTLVDVPQGNDEVAWNTAATQAGLHMIRQPAANPASDSNNSLLLAWDLDDEPDLNGITAATELTKYQNLKSIDSKIPVLINFAGGDVLNLQGSCNQACYQTYGQALDWGSSDIYPITGWGAPNNLGWVGQSITQLYQWLPGKPEFAFIETSNQQLPWIPSDTGPTPAQVTAEIWDALIHGAKGFSYFPLGCPNGGSCSFSFDATPANVVTAITAQDSLVESLAAPLLAPLNPSGQSVSVSSPLEVSWRVSGSNKYVIVLNFSSNTVTSTAIHLTGFTGTSASVVNETRTVPISSNTITDTFTPDQVHIYQL